MFGKCWLWIGECYPVALFSLSLVIDVNNNKIIIIGESDPVALFSLSLVIDVNEFSLSTAPADLNEASVHPFHAALATLHDIPSLEQALLPRCQ